MNGVTSRLQIDSTEVLLVQGDITDLDTDAIVNAANKDLVLGAGVAGAIRRKGGPAIQEECDRIGGTVVGGAVLTTGGRLKARHVIHAVGPRMGEGDEDRKLRDATLNSFRLADEKGLSSIAFPAISTGIFGFPIERCAQIMLTATRDHLTGCTTLRQVVFCLFDSSGFSTFSKELHKLVSGPSS
ncbi:MAG: macro domain-containing protein [Acidobacteriota bacterium]